VDTAQHQQMGTDEELDFQNYFRYFFQRSGMESGDSQIHGAGAPARRCGLIRSAFRPSDDAVSLPFHIPGNAMFANWLERVATDIMGESFVRPATRALRDDCKKLAREVSAAVWEHGVVTTGTRMGTEEKVFAYEVDGFGNFYLMDDANIPGLLSLPLIAPDLVTPNNPVYLATRAKILSVESNPYFFKGAYGEGIGGPHVYLNYIWPMSVVVRGWTAMLRGELEDGNAADGQQKNVTKLAVKEEIRSCLQTLLNTHAGTFFMHESFLKTNPSVYTRTWFAWANSLFGDWIVQLWKSPAFHDLLQEEFVRVPVIEGNHDNLPNLVRSTKEQGGVEGVSTNTIILL